MLSPAAVALGLLIPALSLARAEPSQKLSADELESQLAIWNEAVAAGRCEIVLSELELLADPTQDPRLLNLRGVCLSALGRHAESLADFEAAIRRDPRTPAAHRNLAIALGELGQLGRAMAEFQQALELDSADDEARLGLAHAQIRARRYALAKATLDGASGSDDLRYFYARAALADASSDSALAVTVWSQLEAADPSAESARRLAALLPRTRREEWLRHCVERDETALDCRAALGQSLLEAGDAEASATVLRPLLEQPKLEPATLHNFLLALSALRAWDEIEAACERHAPQQADSWGVVALARREAGRADQARSAVARARELAPENLDLANLEAVLLAEAGQRDAATRVWRWILERDPQHLEAKRNLAASP